MAGNALTQQLTQAALAQGIDPRWANTIAQIESNDNPNAVSSVGAQGMMQLMPATAKALGVQNPANPQQNINGGVALLKQDLQRYGNPVTATAAYFGGTNQANWGPKTQQYVAKAEKVYQSMPSQNNTPVTTPTTDPEFQAWLTKNTATDVAPAGGSNAPVASGPDSDPDFQKWLKTNTADDTVAATPGAPPAPTTAQQVEAGAERGLHAVTDVPAEALASGVGDAAHALGIAPNWTPGANTRAADQQASQAYQQQYGDAKVLSPANIANVGTQLGVGGAAIAGGEGLANAAADAVSAVPYVGPAVQGATRFLTGRAGQFTGNGAAGAIAKVGSLAGQGAVQGAGFNALTGRPVTPAVVGANALLSPVIGGAGSLVGGIAHGVTSGVTQAATQAARAVLNASHADGGLPAATGAAGDTLATTGGPNVQGLAEELANRPGPGRNIVSNYFDNLMGAQPSVLTAAVNKALGPNSNVSDLVDTTIQQRAAAAAPLYEKAFAGGSTAPLQSQLTDQFNAASSKAASAQRDVQAANSALTLARGKQTQTGGDVYSTSTANQENSEAEANAAQAQSALDQANQEKAAIQDRLQQAQADGTANAPGAVWSPRIQQFLDDPIAKAGIARGIELQRLDALAAGKPFNPTEYAITGQDADGNPTVGAVPTMRTLDAVKRGMDAIISDNTDQATGKVNTYGRSVNLVNNAFKSELDNLNPTYAEARAAYAGPSQVMDAARLGAKVFSSDSDVTAKQVAQMGDSEKAGFQAGAAQAILRKMGQVQDGGKVARIFSTPNAREAVSAAFNSPQEAQQFMDTAEQLNNQANAKNVILGNSRTALRANQGGHDWMGTAVSAGANALTGRPHVAAFDLLRGMANHARAQGNPDYDTALANLLTNSNQQQVANALLAGRPGVASRVAGSAGNSLVNAARLAPLTGFQAGSNP